MAYLRDLLIGRIATETVYGSDYVMSAKLMGVKEMEIVPKMETEAPDVLDGRYSPGDLLVRTREFAEGSITQLLTYEDVCFWMNGTFGKLEATDVGGFTTNSDSCFLRAYAAPVTAFATDAAAVPTYNLQFQDAGSASSDFWRMVGGFVKSWSITAERGAPSEIRVDLAGQKVIAASTDALEADRTVVPVMGDHWSVYINNDTDAVGTTLMSDIAFKFSLDVDTHREPEFHLGDLNPGSYKDAGWEGKLALTLQLGSEAQGFMSSIITSGTKVKKVIRLKATTGTAGTLKLFQVDFAGALLESPTLFTDQDGIVSLELNLQGSYNSTMANWLKVAVTNGAVTP